MKSNTSKAVSTKDIVKEIKTLVEESIKACYGVAEIALGGKKGNEEKIAITLHSDKSFDVEIHVIMAVGVKITESLFEAQKIVKYRVDRAYPKLCNKVNVLADAISSK